MGYSFFVNRPVLSSVISILIVFAGLICLRLLPVGQYPDLMPPSVFISASYPGASAESVAQTVGAPLEQQLNGLEHMLYMRTVANAQGTLSIQITFALGTDVDKAAVEVNNCVQRVVSSLPEEVQRAGVRVVKRSSSSLGLVTLLADGKKYDQTYLGNYALLNVVDDLKRLPGVGSADVMGGAGYAMHIWLQPDKLAQYRLTISEVLAQIRQQNAQYPVGHLGATPDTQSGAYTYSVVTDGRLSTAEEFGNIILRSDQKGSILRLKDVARVELGAVQYLVKTLLNGKPMVPIMINLQSGANALATMEAVKKKMAQLSENFPMGISYSIPYDTTKFIKISVEEVIYTFFEAMALVILVVFLFLQKFRASIIPLLAVPISIIGTFAGMYILGFSINMLTLFGLVLAIGIVVDDAIVVLENVERLMQEEGLAAREATIKSMSQVSGPVIAIVLVLCSVFVPISFLGGMAGTMYKQFAITISLSVVFSGLVALTFTPALAAQLLDKQHSRTPLFFIYFNKMLDKLTAAYCRVVEFFLDRVWLGCFVFLAFCLGALVMFIKIPSSLVPTEDQGSMIAFAMLPPASSLERTEKVMHKAQEIFSAHPAIENVASISGFDLMSGGLKSSAGVFFLSLKDWDARAGKPALDPRNMAFPLMGQLSQSIKDGFVMAVNPPPLRGLSTMGGFDLYLQDRGGKGVAKLYEVTQKYMHAASERPELFNLRTTFDPNVPQYFVKVDREKALAMGVAVNDIYQTMSATLGSTYVNDFMLYGRNYEVLMQADAPFRRTPNDLSNIFVRSHTGKMVPLNSLVLAQRTVGADQIERFDGFTSMRITGQPAAGYTSGQAINAMKEVAQQVLSKDFQIAWTGSAYQELQAGSQATQALIFGIIMVFLILAAQYERWTMPFVVITALPFTLFGALLFAWARGMSNDIYLQIGLVTLVGIASKNAILIVEFAMAQTKAGLSVREAALLAAKMRFRPIVMTSLAFILGTLPLMLSTGAGAESRHSLGTGVVGGMLAATCIATLFVPLFYTLIAGRSK